jgi:hypothetical protein
VARFPEMFESSAAGVRGLNVTFGSDSSCGTCREDGSESSGAKARAPRPFPGSEAGLEDDRDFDGRSDPGAVQVRTRRLGWPRH